MTLDLTFVSKGLEKNAAVEVKTGVIAGWTGRDLVSMNKHIKELEELGVRAPKFTPTFYRVSAARFTTAKMIEVVGGQSSGEAEFVLLKHDGKIWVGVGSDHTDRHVEAYDVTVSKQMCEKPLSPVFWDFDDVAAHWDTLVLSSYIYENGARCLYQEGPVTQMRAPLDLMELYQWQGKGLPEGAIMFCGTSAAIGGIRPAGKFEFSLHDPKLQRTLSHEYEIVDMPPFAETKGMM